MRCAELLGDALRHGLSLRGNCSKPCTARFDLLVSAREAKRLKLPARLRKSGLGHLQRALAAGRYTTVRVPFSSAARRALRSATHVELRVRLTTVDSAGHRSAPATLKFGLRR